MATAPEDESEDDVLELGPDQEAVDQQGDDGDELVLDGEQPPAHAESPSIRQVREHARKLEREVAELRRASAPKPIDVGPEPVWNDNTQERYDYDPAKFIAERDGWLARKGEQDQRQQQAQQQTEAQQAEVRTVRERYLANAAQTRARLKVSDEDYRKHEDALSAVIPDAVKDVLIGKLPNAPAVVQYLGSRPDKLEQIAAITDPLEQVFALRDLSKGLQMKPKVKSPPPPEERVSGSAPVSRQGDDKKLKKLLDEARRTGKRTDLIAYKQSLEKKK